MFTSETLAQENMTVQARCEFLYFKLLQKYLLQGELRLNVCPVYSGLHKTNKNKLMKSHTNSSFLSIFVIWKKGMDGFWVGAVISVSLLALITNSDIQ